MHKGKSPWGNFSLGITLSLGSLVLGIGFVSWALINIGAKSVEADYVYRDPSANPTTIAVKQVPDHPSKILNAEKVFCPLYPAEGEIIGSLSIPVLKQKLPIIQGTGADELKKGVGHFTQSVMPGEEDNSVLSGHRDTVFANLGQLKGGDQLIVQTSAGTFTYEIKRIRIVDKDDKTVIVPTDHAVLTVTTCYPFRFVGNAPNRYILTADLMMSK